MLGVPSMLAIPTIRTLAAGGKPLANASIRASSFGGRGPREGRAGAKSSQPTLNKNLLDGRLAVGLVVQPGVTGTAAWQDR